MRREAGLGLTGTSVILGAIGLLAAVLLPTVFDYIEDQRASRAQVYSNAIAKAIVQLYRDTRRLPYMTDPSASARPLAWQAGDYYFLTGEKGNCPAEEVPWGIDLNGQNKCTGAGTDSDTLENHLVNNRPGGQGRYPATGQFRWRGPYLDPGVVDPWGNKYVVNIRQADPLLGPRAVFVLSAGRNGKIETAFDQAADSFTVGGDDIVARVK